MLAVGMPSAIAATATSRRHRQSADIAAAGDDSTPSARTTSASSINPPVAVSARAAHPATCSRCRQSRPHEAMGTPAAIYL